MNILRRLLFVVLTGVLALPVKARYSVHTTPVVPLGKSVAGHFSGELNGQLWTWGGFDLARDTVSGVFNPSFFFYGHGAAVEVPHGTLCVGGCRTNDHASLKEVFLTRRLTYREDGMSKWQYDRGSQQSFVPLPKGLQEHAAVYSDGYIYVLGGHSDSIANHQVYRLQWPDGTAWDSIAVMPGKARIGAVAAVQKSAHGPCLYLFGGYAPASSADSAFVHTDALALDLSTFRWRTLEWEGVSPEHLPTVGAFALPLGCSSVAVFGGVNAQVFTHELNAKDLAASGYYGHPSEWYRYQSDVLIYNTYTNSWKTLPGSPVLARAYAGWARVGGFWFINGGMVQPGKCTNQVECVELIDGRGPSPWNLVVIVFLAMLGLLFLLGNRLKKRWLGFSFLVSRHHSRVVGGITLFMAAFGGIALWGVPFAVFVYGWGIILPYVAAAVLFFLFALYFATHPHARGGWGYKVLSSFLLVMRMMLWVALPAWVLSEALGLYVWGGALFVSLVPLLAILAGGRRASVCMDVFQFVAFVLVSVSVVTYLTVSSGQCPFTSVSFDALQHIPLWAWAVPVLPFLTLDCSAVLHLHSGMDARSVRYSIFTAFALTLVVGLLMWSLGASLHGYYQHVDSAVLSLFMPHITMLLPEFASAELPIGMSGLFLAVLMGQSWAALLRQSRALAQLMGKNMDESRLSVEKLTAPSRFKAFVVLLFVGVISVLLLAFCNPFSCILL